MLCFAVISPCATPITGRWMPGYSRLPRTPAAIVVSPLVPRADSRKFEMHGSRLDGRRMQVPRREVIAPHRAALEWHQNNVFRA